MARLKLAGLFAGSRELIVVARCNRTNLPCGIAIFYFGFASRAPESGILSPAFVEKVKTGRKELTRLDGGTLDTAFMTIRQIVWQWANQERFGQSHVSFNNDAESPWRSTNATICLPLTCTSRISSAMIAFCCMRSRQQENRRAAFTTCRACSRCDAEGLSSQDTVVPLSYAGV